MEGFQMAGIDFQLDADGALRMLACCREVGDLVIAFDDGEVTVFIGDFTHCHFTPGAEGDLTAADQVGEAVAAAVDFVRGILDDKWVVWKYSNGAGGCYEIGEEENPMANAPLEDDVQRFLWSGPCPRSGMT